MLVESIDKLEDDVLKHLFELSPRTAVSLGLHEYDGRLPKISRAGLDSWYQKARDLIKTIIVN